MSTTSSGERVALSVLDLAPIPPGGTSRDAIVAAIELAQAVEEAGFRGYWVGEHHLGPGRAGAAPTILSALIAQETQRIQLGTAVAVLPNYSPLAFVEQFGTIAALHPGRVQIGIGRASTYAQDPITPAVEAALARLRRSPDIRGGEPPVRLELGEYPALIRRLLRVEPFENEDFVQNVFEAVALLTEEVAEIDGELLHAAPGFGVAATPWLFGWTAGPSARLAGALGLPYVANAHNHAFPLAENVAHYREHFRPSAYLSAPYVAVSTQTLVAETRQEAEQLGESYTRWIHLLLRRGWAVSAEPPGGPRFVPGASDEQAALDQALSLRALGRADDVVEHLNEVVATADADELIVHTFTADTASRRRSYELLGDAWAESGSLRGSPALSSS